MPVTAYSLGFNEEANLRELLPTLAWADEVLYVDSSSADGTAKLCAERGVRWVNVPFEGAAELRKRALQLDPVEPPRVLPCLCVAALRNQALDLARHDWVVSFDTDERCTPEFVAELRAKLAAPDCAAYFVPRRNTFLGKPVRFGGMYPDYRQPQVFDRRRFRYREDLVHEGFECDGPIGYFKAPIWQHPFPTLAVVMAKNEKYTTLMARSYLAAGRKAGLTELALHPLGGFVKKYVIQQGFRDGARGFMIAGLHAYYTFVKYAKLWEMQQAGNPKSEIRSPKEGRDPKSEIEKP
jgi:glycosyltransferase involved in cell wall biosynthesis